MRKPKRPRAVSREEVQRIIDSTDGEVTWDDIIEVNPGRFRPNPESIARIEEKYRKSTQERTRIDAQIESLTERLEEIQQNSAQSWYTAKLRTTVGDAD